MVTMIFTYDVPVEKQAEYVQATKEKIKPLWESIGCIAYDIWQVADSETGFVKTMLFEDASELKESMARKEADAVKKIFGEFAENVSRKMCTKMS
jgi:quinol monooxygenase YgiN